MKAAALLSVVVVLAVLGAGAVSGHDVEEKFVFADLINDVKERQVELSRHPLFKMLADRSIPARKRMTFAPYWAFLALTGADLLDTWLYIPNPKSDLEKRVNIFIEEDNFHYNFFLHDFENVFGYTLDRFGSYTAVMRHMYGAESRTVRELIYIWLVVATKYNDPIVTLATFEAIEAGLKDLFEVVYTDVYLASEDLKELQYFGATHVELEMNHTQTSWFKEENSPRPLAELEITRLQMEHSLEAIGAMFDK